MQNFTYPNFSSENIYTRFEHFYSFGALQILHEKPLNREKNDFPKADLGILPKNRIQAAVKTLNDGEILWKLYVIFKGPFRIYKDYQIAPFAILSNSATKAIEFYLHDFLESIQYVWAHEDLFCST